MNYIKTNPSEGVSNQTSEINYNNNIQTKIVMRVTWNKFNSSSFKNKLLNYTGIVEIYNEDGTLDYRVNFINGKENGVVEHFNKNGTLRERSNYKDGELNGVLERFYEDGTLQERCNFVDGKYNGVWELFDENGTLGIRCHFLVGELLDISIINFPSFVFEEED